MEDKSSYLVLRGRKHGSYEYPDLDVSMYRLGFNTGIETIDKRVSTAREKNGHKYIGDIVSRDALRLSLNLGNDGALNPRQFVDFKYLLERGIDQEEKVLDPNEKEIHRSILRMVHDEIFKKREPWRGEFLDAYFEVKNNVLYLNQDHKIVKGVLVPEYSKPVLEDSLMESGFVNLKSCNEQGLPTRKGRYIRYEPPSDETVAWFGVGSDRWFGCSRYLVEGSNSALGVRAKKFHESREV